jgi:hypothetical protein
MRGAVHHLRARLPVRNYAVQLHEPEAARLFQRRSKSETRPARDSSMWRSNLYVVRDGNAIHDDDILLGDARDVAHEWKTWKADPERYIANSKSGLNPQGYALRQNSGILFPMGDICYQTESGPDGVNPLEVSAAIADWHKWWPSPAIGPRWRSARCSSGYILFRKHVRSSDPNDRSCGLSYIGRFPNATDVQGRPVQYIYVPGASTYPECGGSFTGIAIRHEMGHAMGLYHEHQRPDRNNYIQVTPPPGSDGAYATIPTTTTTAVTGPYDLRSIMHYANDEIFRLVGGGLLPRSPSEGPLQSISRGDAAAVLSMYVPGSSSTRVFGGITGSSRGVTAAGEATFRFTAAQGQDGALWVNKHSPACSGWCGWGSFGGQISAPPGIATKPGGVVVAARGIGTRVMCLHDDGWTCDGSPAWGSPLANTGYSFVDSYPPIVAVLQGDVYVGALVSAPGGSKGVADNIRHNGVWSGWGIRVVDGVSGNPSIVSDEDIQAHLFFPGTDGGLHQAWNTNIGFSEGTRPPPGLLAGSGISVTSRGPGQFEIWTIGADGLIWGLMRLNGVWGTWKNYGGPLTFEGIPLGAAPAGRFPGNTGQVELFFQEFPYPHTHDPLNEWNWIWTRSVKPQ